MKTSWALRIVVAVLLALCACGGFACVDDDCAIDCHGCSAIADDAVLAPVQFEPSGSDFACAEAVTDQTAYLAHFSITDIFRPPNASA